MVAIRNLYWTEGIAAFIVCGLILAGMRCGVVGAAPEGARAAGPRGVLFTGYWQVAWLRTVHVGASFCAFAALVAGLFALAAYPIMGVLLTIGGMALLLYGAAGLYAERR